jgi:hypothetical protein
MIPQIKIQQIASEVAVANLDRARVESVLSEPTSDSQGRDALRITIIIKPGAAEELSGDSILDTLVQIQERLQREGEERFAFVEYATKDELEESGEP